MKFSSFNKENEKILSMNYYSVGGGFFLSENDVSNLTKKSEKNLIKCPWNFDTGKEVI